MKKTISFLLACLLLFASSTAAFASEEELPFENSAFFEFGDYKLHYRTYDVENEKARIMLLHGFGLSTASLEGVAEEYMSRGFDVFTVDMPNFGYSSRETTTTELVDRERLVYELMSTLGGRWVLGGHSMGGGIAANVAINHPEIVDGLVLFAPQTSAEASGISGFASGFIMRTIFDSIIKIGSRIPLIMRLLVSMSFSDPSFACDYDVSRISDPLKISGTGAGIAIMSSHTRGTDIEAFGRLEIPIVIITASDDRIANKSNLNALIDSGARNLSVFEMERGGHMMMEYAPAEAVELTMSVFA